MSGTSAQGAGVSGTGGASSPGVAGTGTGGAGLQGTSTSGDGVLAKSTSGAGVSASSVEGTGVSGTSTQGVGVSGTGGGANPGVQGTGGAGPGLSGSSTENVGVFGKGGSGKAGVEGRVTFGSGVHGDSTQGNGVEATGAVGLFAKGSSQAAILDGDVVITGTVSDGANLMRIDHPVAPEDRFLIHAAVESSELKNVYDGSAVLDANGRATVELPEWFESLNESFRYQLTAVGAPAPDLHVSRPLTDHTFEIAGGAAGLDVCWQITGVRCDNWARANPLVADVSKTGEEQGLLVHPELIGRPADRSLAQLAARGGAPDTVPEDVV